MIFLLYLLFSTIIGQFQSYSSNLDYWDEGKFWSSYQIPEARGKRACLFTPFGFAPGGGERYFLSTAVALKRMGYKIDIAVYDDAPCHKRDCMKIAIDGLQLPLQMEDFTLIKIDAAVSNRNNASILPYFAPGSDPPNSFPMFGQHFDKEEWLRHHEMENEERYEIFFFMGNQKYPHIQGPGRLNIFMCQFPFNLRPEGANTDHAVRLWETYDKVIVNSKFTLQWYIRSQKTGVRRGLNRISFFPLVEVIHPPVEPLYRTRLFPWEVISLSSSSSSPSPSIPSSTDSISSLSTSSSSSSVSIGWLLNKHQSEETLYSIFNISLSSEEKIIEKLKKRIRHEIKQQHQLQLQSSSSTSTSSASASTTTDQLNLQILAEKEIEKVIDNRDEEELHNNNDDEEDDIPTYSIAVFGRFFRGRASKGHDVAIKLFSQLHTLSMKYHSFKLHLYLMGYIHSSEGAEEYVMELKHNATSLNLPVTFITNAQPMEISRILAKTTIFWHLSGVDYLQYSDYFENWDPTNPTHAFFLYDHWVLPNVIDVELDPGSLEHFGIAIVESMFSGCVPIVTALGGTTDIIQHGYNGFLAHQMEDYLSLTMKFLTSTHEKQVRIRTNAVLSAAKFSTFEFYRRLRRSLIEGLFSTPLRHITRMHTPEIWRHSLTLQPHNSSNLILIQENEMRMKKMKFQYQQQQNQQQNQYQMIHSSSITSSSSSSLILGPQGPKPHFSTEISSSHPFSHHLHHPHHLHNPHHSQSSSSSSSSHHSNPNPNSHSQHHHLHLPLSTSTTTTTTTTPSSTTNNLNNHNNQHNNNNNDNKHKLSQLDHTYLRGPTTSDSSTHHPLPSRSLQSSSTTPATTTTTTTTTTTKPLKKTAVLFISTIHGIYELIATNIMYNLGPTWSLVVFFRKDVDFFSANAISLKNTEFVYIDDTIHTSYDFNDYLTNVSFWNRFEKNEKILLFDLESLIVNPKVIDEEGLLEYDFIAPLDSNHQLRELFQQQQQHHQRQEPSSSSSAPISSDLLSTLISSANLIEPSYLGTGSFSLRTAGVMAEICTLFPKTDRLESESNYFRRYARVLGYKVAESEVIDRFVWYNKEPLSERVFNQLMKTYDESEPFSSLSSSSTTTTIISSTSSSSDLKTPLKMIEVGEEEEESRFHYQQLSEIDVLPFNTLLNDNHPDRTITPKSSSITPPTSSSLFSLPFAIHASWINLNHTFMMKLLEKRAIRCDEKTPKLFQHPSE